LHAVVRSDALRGKLLLLLLLLLVIVAAASAYFTLLSRPIRC